MVSKSRSMLDAGAMWADDAGGNVNVDTLQKELAELRRQNKRLQHRLIEVEQSADMDPLIPIYNRRAFIRELGRAQSVLDRYEISSSVIYFDLDHFKSVNDRFGHAVGDDVIRDVGVVLNSNTRECDMVARLGGDEFGILLFKARKNIAEKKAEALSELIASISVRIPNCSVRVSASWGVCECRTDVTAETVLSDADKRMYAARRLRRHSPA